MSTSFAVVNGDLAVSTGKLQTVSAGDKLSQDLSLWLKEVYQSDRFHPDYGSILDNYIGTVIGSQTQVMIQSEVQRVLANYQALQLQGLNANPAKYQPEELLQSVDSIVVSANYDQVSVKISYRNAVGTTLTTEVSSSV